MFKLCSNRQFARNLDLLTEEGKYNYFAYLLSDNNGVSIKIAKYSGSDKSDLVENKEFGYCSLTKASFNVLNRFDIENVPMTKITSSIREETYPSSHFPAAFRLIFLRKNSTKGFQRPEIES